MASLYSSQMTGVVDGTTIPAGKADGRVVGARRKLILASKKAEAWNSGDTVALGKLRAGEQLVGVRITASASLGTSTVSIGTSAAPTKYVNAKTNTVVDVPTYLGPVASTLDDGPASADEDLIATIGVAAIVAGTFLTIELEIASMN